MLNINLKRTTRVRFTSQQFEIIKRAVELFNKSTFAFQNGMTPPKIVCTIPCKEGPFEVSIGGISATNWYDTVFKRAFPTAPGIYPSTLPADLLKLESFVNQFGNLGDIWMDPH